MKSLTSALLSKCDHREAHCLRTFASYMEMMEEPDRLRWEFCTDDPPDCWLEIGPVCYAVEITSTKVRAGRSGSEEFVPLESWGRASESLCREISERARDLGILDGSFGMGFTTKAAIRGRKFRELKSHVADRALDYITTYQQERQAPARSIYFGATRVCEIRKFAGSPSTVVYTMVDVLGEKETVLRVSDYLHDAVADKAQRLEKKAAGREWILLLLNTDPFAEKCPDVYQRAFVALSGAIRFHSIFVVWGDSTGFMLHSLDPKWQVPPPVDPSQLTHSNPEY